jgi:glycosyltransferase involved in cell wall biosynthesis
MAEKASLEILRQFYRRADHTMAPNNELIEFARKLTGKPCHLMSRGVDTQLFCPSRRKRVNNVLQIGYVGRLTTEKNVRFLVSLAHELQTQCQQHLEFVIVGEGSEGRWLRSNIQNARLPGVLRGEALANAYADMDLFVFPSLTDTFGNVVLEALASGVPAVVTNQGGPKFLVQSGVTGFVAANETEFIRSVSQLTNDPTLRSRMSFEAVKYAQTQSWDRVFESVWNVYGECMALHKPAAVGRRASSSLLSSRVHGRSCP